MTSTVKKQIIIVLLAISFPAFLAFCEKKMFGKVSVEGSILHTNNDPVPGIQVMLLGENNEDARSLDTDIKLADAITDENGHFSITSRRAKSNVYYLAFENPGHTSNYNIKIQDKGHTDLGVFYWEK